MLPRRIRCTIDLLDLLKRLKWKTLGFKRHLSAPDGALKKIMGFANKAGETLLIVVENRRHNLRGVADPLEEEERLAKLISDRINPRLVPNLEILPWRQTQVLALQVYPTPSRPYHLIGKEPIAGQNVRGWAPATSKPMPS